ncbi:hypothetical protein OESDEN_05500 [Oesophagostomum dentatum]|uniref:Uncharacterized protein n=1 Tax=Oesophagostomum dentatum TaxID=61180 RepID=A0A0B1TAI5_OESDE|nr:hypothetical protein OESDEN_05500 [Oesophagostomum dentatum]
MHQTAGALRAPTCIKVIITLMTMYTPVIVCSADGWEDYPHFKRYYNVSSGVPKVSINDLRKLLAQEVYYNVSLKTGRSPDQELLKANLRTLMRWAIVENKPKPGTLKAHRLQYRTTTEAEQKTTREYLERRQSITEHEKGQQ